MKIRNGFVSNSSSSSFTCEICGNSESGFDASPYDLGFVVCINDHIICEDDQLEDVKLTDEEYDNLFDSVIRYFNYKGVQEIVNDEQFGFVKNVLLPFTTPIIFNYNQHGQMMNKVINENKINNLKILPNGELSLSWNRELTEYFIKTN